MVTELADLPIIPGNEDAFTAAFAEARELILSASSCRSARLTRSVKSPSRFVAIFEWDSIEEQEKFASSEAFQPFLALIVHHYAQPPQIDFVTDVL
jgi:quinol monooxygenase YgiN